MKIKEKKFHRKKNIRKALFKIMLHHLIMNERIKTTTQRAKYLKPRIEKLISKGKNQNLATLRYLLKHLPKKSAYKVFYDLSPRYKDRTGGYVRILKLPFKRIKDNADLALVEFIK
ncbi:MAG: 50S ribosomal protein L17 [Candidatus Parcubacteria bacterium]|nr:MAG: 50S ribosomal protein L17 [Candidatus Parcubacteria bacterium]